MTAIEMVNLIRVILLQIEKECEKKKNQLHLVFS